MRLVILQDVSLVSSSVAGSEYDEYDDSHSYSTGDYIKLSYEDDGATPRFPVMEYQSLADANQDNYPPDNPDKWSEIGAENRCKMFDAYTNTQTIDTDDIVVVLDANGAANVGIFGIYGASVTLKLIRAATIKEETFDLRTFIPASGWYNWLFGTYEYGITQLLWDFPQYATGATLEITIAARAGSAACGMVVIGNARTLGVTRYNVRIGIDDYSIKDADPLGRTYLNQGAYAQTAEADMWLTNAQIDYVARQLVAVRGTPAVYDINNTGTIYQSLIIYGTASFDITIPGPRRSKCALTVEGLI